MTVKLFLCIIICTLSYFFGKSYSKEYSDRIKLLDDLISKLDRLKSEVEYSSVNVKNSLLFLKAENEVEKFCNEEIKKIISFSENCNSVDGVANIIKIEENILIEYKNKKQEEYGNKIISIPKLSFLAGIFISVLII